MGKYSAIAVPHDVLKQVKLNAIHRDMRIKDYIELLVAKDTKKLKEEMKNV